MKKHLIIFIISLIAVGGLSFYIGTKHTSANFPTSPQIGSSGRAFNGNFKRPEGATGSLVNGEILSKDDKSVTIKLRDGGSKIIFFSPSTPITKSVAGTADDLAIGANLMINGTTNSDGSATAQMIQLRPADEVKPTDTTKQ